MHELSSHRPVFPCVVERHGQDRQSDRDVDPLFGLYVFTSQELQSDGLFTSLYFPGGQREHVVQLGASH